MSTLADISNENPGLIAYYNVYNQTGLDSSADDVDPSQTTNYSGVTSFTAYDNGVEGKLNLDKARNCHYRMKTDGWIIVYAKEASQDHFSGYTGGSWTNNTPPQGGQYDAVPEWDTYGNGPGPTSVTNGTQFSQELKNLIMELDEWSTDINPVFDMNDVGHYTFDYTSANGVTYFVWNSEIKRGTHTADITATSSTSVYYWAIIGSNHGGDNGTINSYVEDSTDRFTLGQQRSSVRDGLTLFGSFDTSETYTLEAEETANWATEAGIGSLIIWG
jgi:hypothetical protein